MADSRTGYSRSSGHKSSAAAKRRAASRTPRGLSNIHTPRDERSKHVSYSYSSHQPATPTDGSGLQEENKSDSMWSNSSARFFCDSRTMTLTDSDTSTESDESETENVNPKMTRVAGAACPEIDDRPAGGAYYSYQPPRPVPGSEHFTPEELCGRYKFIRYLGHGSYGHVCEAINNANQNRMAIKKVPKIFDNEVDAKRLLRELRILRTLRSHEAIIDIVDILPPKDLMNFTTLSIVFEFVDTDLAKLIASEQFFTTLHVQYMVYQILLGLKYMHSAKIAHRDLKPANILVNEDCSLKICDFGLARGIVENFRKPEAKSASFLSWGKAKEEEKKEDPSPKAQQRLRKRELKSRQLTRHVVTRWYRAPEIILLEQQREHLDKVDMWAVGCIIGELLQMLKENEPNPSNRKPLFPGSSCFPLSPGRFLSPETPESANDPFAYQDRLDQLNVIFDIIGTPLAQEIRQLGNEKARKYLQRVCFDENGIPKKQPKNLSVIFKGSGQAHAIDLVQKLLHFDPKKRIDVTKALNHYFLRNVRDEEAERRHRAIKFDFEDIPLSKQTIKELIIDEIMIWNPDIMEKHSAKHGMSLERRRSLRAESNDLKGSPKQPQKPWQTPQKRSSVSDKIPGGRIAGGKNTPNTTPMPKAKGSRTKKYPSASRYQKVPKEWTMPGKKTKSPHRTPTRTPTRTPMKTTRSKRSASSRVQKVPKEWTLAGMKAAQLAGDRRSPLTVKQAHQDTWKRSGRYQKVPEEWKSVAGEKTKTSDRTQRRRAVRSKASAVSSGGMLPNRSTMALPKMSAAEAAARTSPYPHPWDEEAWEEKRRQERERCARLLKRRKSLRHTGEARTTTLETAGRSARTRKARRPSATRKFF